jgi:hypothetical protein
MDARGRLTFWAEYEVDSEVEGEFAKSEGAVKEEGEGG